MPRRLYRVGGFIFTQLTQLGRRFRWRQLFPEFV
jgi:hypothetical protein